MGYQFCLPAAKIKKVIDQFVGTRVTLDRRGVAFKAVAGLIGGAIGWIPVEIASHGHSLTEAQGLSTLLAGFISMSLMAGVIGGMIIAAEDQSLALTPEVERKFIRGFLVCLGLSIPGTYFSNVLFSSILASGGWRTGQAGSEAYLILARLLGWSLMGLWLGAGVGIASRSLQNVAKGAIGGVIGGFLGGLGFDLIGALSQTGLLSRLLGFSEIGFAIGLLIGLVQELTKRAWMIVDAGRLKGRQFRLEGSAISIGRAEENPIGLFGDPAVQPRHAIIERKGDRFTIRNLAVQSGTTVNGERIESAELHEGDRIQIGDYGLSFHSRMETVTAGDHPRPSIASQVTPARSLDANSGEPCLVRASGERIKLRVGAATRIGRALDNDVVVQDASVSRHHAVIEARHGAYIVRDLGSQNGTWIEGSRVNEGAIQSGTAVRLGDAVFTFHA